MYVGRATRSTHGATPPGATASAGVVAWTLGETAGHIIAPVDGLRVREVPR
ncbi:hypothetical protein ABZS66_02070 [Dactylosporangium sp. NPDC005572]|uniref:hypothetical protein n=1 Tax=Dactylosporangium sp. NPDC005572 TaxID=3156889 RepID=UPI0033A32A00